LTICIIELNTRAACSGSPLAVRRGSASGATGHDSP
jgi:hypothetical protein